MKIHLQSLFVSLHVIEHTSEEIRLRLSIETELMNLFLVHGHTLSLERADLVSTKKINKKKNNNKKNKQKEIRYLRLSPSRK